MHTHVCICVYIVCCFSVIHNSTKLDTLRKYFQKCNYVLLIKQVSVSPPDIINEILL